MNSITKTYGQRTVLHIPELHIHQGETFTLVGPSGAGKSTLLRLLAFLEKPSTGQLSVRLGQQTYTPQTMTIGQRRQLAMVFQEPVLLTRSVRQNIAYGLQIRGQHHWQRDVDAMLHSVKLEHVAEAPAHTLSGGEKQRVAIARALVLSPEVLILDEPTANLDPQNIRIIETLLQSHCENTTIIMVTHNIFQAKRLADRVALLLEGQLVEASDNDTFFNNPNDKRTTAFVEGDIIY